jgi:hypothetical protein
MHALKHFYWEGHFKDIVNLISGVYLSYINVAFFLVFTYDVKCNIYMLCVPMEFKVVHKSNIKLILVIKGL